MKTFFVILALACSALSSPIGEESVETAFMKSGHGGHMKHLNIDTWLTAEQYQILIDNGIPVEQKFALSELNLVPSPYDYPTEFTQEQAIRAAISQINQPLMRTNLLTLEAFNNRHYQSQTGVESANWIYNNLLSIASTNPLISVSKFTNTWVQHSVIAKFQGSNSNLPIIVIGAHQDSIAGGANTRAPGADDNGSGSVTILEVFRILASQSFAPAATVEFHWYSAEEAGLLGSKAIANKYAADGVKVAAMLNYDVVGYTAKQKVIGVITDYVDASLTAFLRTVVNTFSIVPLKDTRCNYACSDHASWGSAGYPSGFLVEAEMSNSSPYMHTQNDVIATVDFDHLVEFAKIAIGYVVELGQTTKWAKK